MTFISYSQNFEDVLLWRALGHLENGFYIDVGANDPVEHSVTKAFYDRGWHGINIEPLPSFQQVFVDKRPRDINLAVAAGASESEISLFDVPSVNGWASNNKAVAEAHLAEGFSVVELKVPQRTLNAICAQHVTGDIHFLKIDVEGFEGEVLRGIDLTKWRPWILVVEATMPNSRLTNQETWEHLVTDHNYHFAYFDGLNRYYVAGEQLQLRDIISVQANVFDEFISTHLDQAWKSAQEANELVKKLSLEAQEQLRKANERTYAVDAQLQDALAETRRVEAKLNASNASLHEVWKQQQALQHELHLVYASRSWKLTRPLRWAITTVRSLKTKKWLAPLRWAVKKVLALRTRNIPQNMPQNSPPTIVNAITVPLECAAENKNLTMSARKTLHDLTSRATSAK